MKTKLIFNFKCGQTADGSKMKFQKISAPSLKELFVQELEYMILSGKLQTGEKLPPERELAESMHVSRAVVNSGITHLARKGFLTIKPRVGTFIADYRKTGTLETLISIMNYNGGILRDSEIRSILEIRIALDTLAIELCIPKITDEEVLSLKAITKSIRLASSIEEASQLAFSFQHELAVLSGNLIMPLIFHSFKVPILCLWERFCQLYGIESLYLNTETLCQFIEERKMEKAIESLRDSIHDTISGGRPIYFQKDGLGN